ncbi:MAG: hypothetical protein CL694_15695 [Chloroflexi bacterium]|nr:hypothetical protein [Chloroflexota bacterium]
MCTHLGTGRTDDDGDQAFVFGCRRHRAQYWSRFHVLRSGHVSTFLVVHLWQWAKETASGVTGRSGWTISGACDLCSVDGAAGAPFFNWAVAVGIREVVLVADNPNPTVLVIEDDQAISDIVSRVLGEEGFATHAAYDGVQGLDAYQATVDRQRKWDTFGPENKRDYCR